MGDFGDIQIDIAQVNYQKQPGRIRLSMSHVLWDPDLVGEKQIIEIPKIRNQKISADGKTKVQIQLQMTDGKERVPYFQLFLGFVDKNCFKNVCESMLWRMRFILPTTRLPEKRKKCATRSKST